jgi:FMN reductase
MHSGWPRGRPYVVGLGGTTRPNSSSEKALRYVLVEMERLGATTRIFDGQSLSLPMYAAEIPFRTEESLALIQALRNADGIILSSPGYHGSISGMLKNALDYTEDMSGDERPYFEHRVVGCIVCAAGWQAVGSTLIALRSIVHALRGWPTPLGVGINTAATRVFDDQDKCVDEVVGGQLRILARQTNDFLRWRGMNEGVPLR